MAILGDCVFLGVFCQGVSIIDLATGKLIRQDVVTCQGDMQVSCNQDALCLVDASCMCMIWPNHPYSGRSGEDQWLAGL